MQSTSVYGLLSMFLVTADVRAGFSSLVRFVPFLGLQSHRSLKTLFYRTFCSLKKEVSTDGPASLVCL